MTRALFLSILVLSFFDAIVGHAQPCDPNQIDGQLTYADVDSVHTEHHRAGYDLHQGRLFGFHASYGVFEVVCNDVYAVSGLPPGVDLPIHVDLALNIAGTNDIWDSMSPCENCSMHTKYVEASIHTSSGESDSIQLCICWKTMRSIGVALTVRDSEEFGIRYRIRADAQAPSSGAGTIGIEASIRFTGVPAGATLTSCHGVIDGAVPTGQATWGSMKARYR